MSEKFDCSDSAAHSSLHARLLGLLKTYSENRYLKIFWRPWMRIIIYSWKLSLVPLALHYTTNYLSSHMPPPDHWLKIAEMQINAVSPNTCLVSCHTVISYHHVVSAVWSTVSTLDIYWGVNLSLLSSLYSNPVASISTISNHSGARCQCDGVSVWQDDNDSVTVWQCEGWPPPLVVSSATLAPAPQRPVSIIITWLSRLRTTGLRHHHHHTPEGELRICYTVKWKAPGENIYLSSQGQERRSDCEQASTMDCPL